MIDGGGVVRKFWYGTMQQLKTIIVAAIVLRVISLVNSHEIILILTGGGPGRSTLVLSLHAFLKAYREYNFGAASAVAVLIFGLLMALSYFYVRVSNVMRE